MAVLSSRKGLRALRMTFVYAVIAIGMLAVMSPFFWMVSTSLKRRIDVVQIPMKWIPNPFLWSNYPEVFELLPFWTFIYNTIKLVFWGVLGGTVASSVAAFAFARLRWPGRDKLFLLVLATMMLPGQVTMIPRFIIFKELDWLDTYLPLLVPAFLGGSAFHIFLLRQYFMTIPLELDDAARIDGCSRLGIFARIILPLSKPALVAVVIFTVRSRWNAFMMPMIYLYDYRKYPISLGLRLFQTSIDVDWAHLMAAATMSILPMLVLFYFAQDYFIRGVVFTGVKG